MFVGYCFVFVHHVVTFSCSFSDIVFVLLKFHLEINMWNLTSAAPWSRSYDNRDNWLYSIQCPAKVFIPLAVFPILLHYNL